MSIIELAHNLELSDNEIWVSNETSSTSYPEDGHSRCYQIEDHSFWFQHRNDCIVAAIKRFPPLGDILEVGGGNGYVARRLLDEGFGCSLLEPSLTGALNAKLGRKIPEVICSTLEGAQFEHGELAAVGMFDVIEHIKDDFSMTNELYNLLQPGGLVYCTIPTHQWLWSKHDETAGHFRRYDIAGIKKLFSDQFELLYFSYFFSALVVPMFLLKALPFRLLGGRSILSLNVEHATENQMSGAVLQGLLNKEIAKIGNNQRIRTGTSGLVVARKC